MEPHSRIAAALPDHDVLVLGDPAYVVWASTLPKIETTVG
jgi:hypothetical protein